MKPERMIEAGFLALAAWSLVSPEQKKRAELRILKWLEQKAMHVARVSADIAASAEDSYRERLSL